MKATLGIYKDCSSKEPSKTYVCERLLFGVSKKALAIYKDIQGSEDYDKQIEAIIDLIQTIFPDFDKEEIDYVDPKELINFVSAIVSDTNAELHKSQKN